MNYSNQKNSNKPVHSYGLVLLGYSGAGKDTIASALSSLYPGLTANVKFSELTKRIIANLYGVEYEKLNDKDWRSTAPLSIDSTLTRVTPLDLLTALFKGSPGTQLHQENIEFALSRIPQHTLPIFTDVRRTHEFHCITQSVCMVYTVHLRADFLGAGTNDGDVDAIAREAKTLVTLHRHRDTTVDDSVNQLLDYTGIEHVIKRLRKNSARA